MRTSFWISEQAQAVCDSFGLEEEATHKELYQLLDGVEDPHLSFKQLYCDDFKRCQEEAGCPRDWCKPGWGPIGMFWGSSKDMRNVLELEEEEEQRKEFLLEKLFLDLKVGRR